MKNHESYANYFITLFITEGKTVMEGQQDFVEIIRKESDDWGNKDKGTEPVCMFEHDLSKEN